MRQCKSERRICQLISDGCAIVLEGHTLQHARPVVAGEPVARVIEADDQSRILVSAQGRAGDVERKMPAPTQEQVRTRSGRVLARPPTSGHTHQLSIYAVASPRGAAVLAAAKQIAESIR